jgi:hypothetical protein
MVELVILRELNMGGRLLAARQPPAGMTAAAGLVAA